jgi:alanine racemase
MSRPERIGSMRRCKTETVRPTHPAIHLSGTILRSNVRAWKQHTGSALRAVVKANGYGFGIEKVARELRDVVDGFVVTDVDELKRIRTVTAAPAATLIDLGPEHANAVANLHGIANVARLDSLASLSERSDARRITVRIGLRLAAGWSAIDMRDAGHYAGALARCGMRTELWLHLSNPATEREDRERFACFIAVFREAGVRIAGEDIESTLPAAVSNGCGSHVRIGAGLFGARGNGSTQPPLKCAIAITAPVVDRLVSDGQLRFGYGVDALARGTQVTVLRCGYADGFPRIAKPYRDLLSVGMQYSVMRGDAPEESFELLGAGDDLDELAAAVGVLPHQIVTGLGCHARSVNCGA